jgi:hypothetical protein
MVRAPVPTRGDRTLRLGLGDRRLLVASTHIVGQKHGATCD